MIIQGLLSPSVMRFQLDCFSPARDMFPGVSPWVPEVPEVRAETDLRRDICTLTPKRVKPPEIRGWGPASSGSPGLSSTAKTLPMSWARLLRARSRYPLLRLSRMRSAVHNAVQCACPLTNCRWRASWRTSCGELRGELREIRDATELTAMTAYYKHMPNTEHIVGAE